MAEPGFDPRAILTALERENVAYVLIGGLARILRGADETTNGIDISPSLRASNLPRLQRALEHLDATPATGKRRALDLAQLDQQPVVPLKTPAGPLQLVAQPAGTRNGYDDLRRGATGEHIGHGLRPTVASIADLARMAAALGRDQDLRRLGELRRIMELEVGLHRHLERDR
jgi:hypothetical protein